MLRGLERHGPAYLVGDVQCCVGMIIIGEGDTCVLAFQREFWMLCSDRAPLCERRVDLVEEVLNLRGSLRSRTVLDGVGSGMSPLARASALPGQGLYLGRQNRPARRDRPLRMVCQSA
jgi:hypothetical protein